MPTYIYPDAVEIEEVEQKLLPVLTADDPIFGVFPFDSSDSDLLIWEQKDNFKGLQNLRGYNGRPLNITRAGSSRYIAEPGIYGDKVTLDERELSQRRRWATLSGGPINVTDMVGEAFEQLLTRRLNLVKKILWDLLISGSFSVASGSVPGVTYTGSYTQQAYTPSVVWSTLATSTPLADMRTYRSFEAGQSCSFGATAVQLMNYVTANYLLNNTNANDLGGKRMGGGNTSNSLKDVNAILIMNDLPPVVIHNGGYIDESGTFNYFIPNGKVAVVGNRTTGRKAGRYRYTRNINSPNAAAAPYSRVIAKGDNEIPVSVEVHDGHNGGPVLQFPGSLIKVNAA
jgi:hypothetical protein